MELRLDDEQAGLLREVLDVTLRDLSYEISDTDNPEYKRGLRGRRDSLRAVRELLGGPDTAGSA
jgi:hypothetical protein